MGKTLIAQAEHLMTALNTFLTGVKVLDLSQYIPGPMASLFLADMGADVLKIEPPNGDEMRQVGPRDSTGRPIFYDTLNSGKSVRRLNLKNPAERDDFLETMLDYDVLIEGFRPGVMGRLGLDYDTLCALHPGLIFCSLSGYGATGAEAGKAAHDGNYLATSGIMARNGADAPVYFDPPLSDTSGALFAAMTILGALHGRARTGRGCRIDIGLADVAMPLQMLQVAAFGAIGANPGPRETYLNGGAAYYNVYRTRDGRHVMLGAMEQKFWTNFCMAAKRPAWVARHADHIPQNILIDEVSAFFATIDLAQALALFADKDCCLSPVLDLAEAMREPQLQARNIVRRAPHGEWQALYPAWINGAPPPPRPPVQERSIAPAPDYSVQPRIIKTK